MIELVRRFFRTKGSPVKRSGPRVLLAGYRSWAVGAASAIMSRVGADCSFVRTNEELLSRLRDGTKFDVVCLFGWSWIVPDDLVKKNLMMGVHPWDLPEYAGGSPIQHQVLDGLTETMASFGRLKDGIDNWDVVLKEPLSLKGNVHDIFERLEDATISMFWAFYESLVQMSSGQWVSTMMPLVLVPNPSIKKRLKPEQSKLTDVNLTTMTARELYNFIRCRTQPYPNAFISDGTGTLRFTDVEFDEPNDN